MGNSELPNILKLMQNKPYGTVEYIAQKANNITHINIFEFRKKYTIREKTPAEPGFCLETAICMSHLSYATYYEKVDDPDLVSYIDSKTITRLYREWVHIINVQGKGKNICAHIFTRGNEIAIAFRGTYNAENVQDDISFFRKKFSIVIGSERAPASLSASQGSSSSSLFHSAERDYFKERMVPVKIHGGFFACYQSIGEAIKDHITQLIASEPHKYRVLYVTGHSLGGALASIMALEMKCMFNEMRVISYTFGSPRVGNLMFASLYDKLVPETYRVVNYQDFVPNVPRVVTFFKHVGKEVLIDKHGYMLMDSCYMDRILRPSKFSMKLHSIATYDSNLHACYRRELIAIRASNHEMQQEMFGEPDIFADEISSEISDSTDGDDLALQKVVEDEDRDVRMNRFGQLTRAKSLSHMERAKDNESAASMLETLQGSGAHAMQTADANQSHNKRFRLVQSKSFAFL
eukprot:TRINITY_DN4856_c0_g1_i14.p1 TRINITY_DN4856_c0_g1~~TRINITY_DN4856_c0_g1_i14.p1  ORF type:complete len:463 (+),score=75.72 TRINITY_DN4856_c0_g1_i14:79-1467(+)